MGSRRTIRRRETRRRKLKREREEAEKQSNHQSEAQSQQSQSNTHHQAPLENNWAIYNSAPGFLSFANCIQENQQQLPVQGTAIMADGSRSPVGRVEDGEIRLADIPQFGLPGPRDPRFQNRVWVPEPAPVGRERRTFQDVLSEHPEVQFGGLNREAIKSVADTVFEITTEVILTWLRKWCPNIDLASVLEDKIKDQQENPAELPVFIVPTESMNIRPTGTTLANLYRKCREVSDKNSRPSPLEFAQIADHCLIICQVLKDEKSVDIINKIKTIVQWQHIGLDCKKKTVLQDAAEEMEQNNSFHPAVIESREEAILKFVTNAYELHQFQFMIAMLQQVKDLFEANYPTLIRRDGPGVIPNNRPASHNPSNQGGVIVVASAEVIEISDDSD
ncbi:hypothetical protein F4776DRAFT_24219 [Hypoxylon sp. NC0597]|nr:hypothetical protein F4776DRAFT_24219 [Hypoxylon sp. NC0597]